MSLSKFYKDNAGFQARAILDSITSAGNDPVWESIVKEEVVPQVPPEALAEETPLPDDTSPVGTEPEPADAILQNTASPEAAPQEPTELPPSSSPPPPEEPAIDIKAISKEAYAHGIEEGKRQAKEDFENSALTLINTCEELNHLRETILRNSTAEMKELVLGIAEKIIRHSVTEQHDTIVDTIKDAIYLAVQSDAFQIRLNPDDLKAVEARKHEIIDSIGNLDNIVLKADPEIDPGGCLLESNCCTVDASMSSQLHVIRQAILNDENLIKPSGS